MSTMEPEVIEGGSNMEGNSIYAWVSVVGDTVVLLVRIPIVCPQSREQPRPHRPCQRSGTPASWARLGRKGLRFVACILTSVLWWVQ